MGFAKYIFFLIFIAGTLSSIALYQLNNNPSLRKQVFKYVYTFIQSKENPEMNKLKCDVLQQAYGKVMDIAIEPNENMHPELNAKLKEAKFSTSVVNASIEDLPAEIKGLDSVISTHTLCSLPSTRKALHAIHRVLKKGGKFIFMEHVRAKEGATLALIHKLIQPVWRIIGDGCEFRPIWEDLEAMRDLWEIQYEHFEAPSISLIKPHIRGHAIKK
jgi:SAM-dependent methyltransferase